MGASTGTFADLDGDGRADLVLANPMIWYLHGRGDCTFDPPVKVLPHDPNRAGIVNQINVVDVDLDGLPDLAISQGVDSDRPQTIDRPVLLLINQGDGSFIDRSPVPTPWQQTGPYYTYGTLWEDLDDDGVRDLMAIVDYKMAWMSWGMPGNEPAYQQDEAISALVSGNCAMSVSPLDFDRDGAMDYFVAHDSGHSTLLSFHGRTVEDRADAAGLTQQEFVNPTNVWSTYAFDADLDGWVDLLALRLSSSDGTSVPPVFWHNNHDGTFVNLRKDVLGDAVTDGRTMVCGDAMSNGHVVCYALLAGKGGVAIENALEPAGNWVGIRLRGTVSAPAAEGARISRSGAEPPQVLYYGPQSPTMALHDPAVLMAIGSASSTDVDVTWPSGIVQHVSGLVASTYSTITEPQVLTLSRRTAAADGQQLVDVMVDPRAIGVEDAVSIEKTGSGSWLGDAKLVGGVWRRTLCAPPAPGDARIDVTVGTQHLRIRPRVTFQ